MSADSTESADSVLDTWRRWYHLPGLALLILFMFWMRIQPYDKYVTDDQVYFRGNDAYYHFRATMYSVENWPRTSYMDPWTHFPYGSTVGQFGTVFDLVVATIAMIVGAGSPSEQQVAIIAVLVPAVLGSLCAVPVYYIVRRLTRNRMASLFGAFVFVILPTGVWVTRSTAGFYDHPVAENFLMGTTILALLVAVSVAQREKPVYEQLIDQDWAGLKDVTKWSALVGVSYALYVWTWPPGVIIAGIVGTYFLVAILAEVLRGNSPEHLAFAGAISMGVGAILVLPLVKTLGFESTDPSLVQVFVPLTVAVGCVFLAWLARQWNEFDLEPWGYLAAVGGVGAVATIGVYFLLPSAFDTIVSNIQLVLIPGSSETTATVSEAQPMDLSKLGREFYNTYGYGFTFLTALLGMVLLGVRSYARSERWEEYLVVVVWSAYLTLMAITQTRFHYYLVSVVPILTAYLFWWVYELADFSAIQSPKDVAVVGGTALFAFGFPIVADIRDLDIGQQEYVAIAGALVLLAAAVVAADYFGDVDFELEAVETYHLLIVALIALVIVIPIASPAAHDDDTRGEFGTAAKLSEAQGPGSVTVWQESNDWLTENTPEVGNYGGAGNADQIDYYGSFEATDDYQYPDGAYGVMSWWDYGHWITVEGERIPNANPFQQGPRPASQFLLTDEEERAELILDAMPADRSAYDRSNDELRETVEGLDQEQESEQTRYVMIDHQMAAGKFTAITRWTGPEAEAFVDQREYTVSGSGENATQEQRLVASQRYYDSMLASLYVQDASGLEHYRLVHETDDFQYVGGNQLSGSQRRFSSISVDRLGDLIANAADSDAPLAGANGSWNQELAEFDSGLRTRNLFGQTHPYGLWDGRLLASVKTFERVEGATLTGTTEPGTNVSVSVDLDTNVGRQTTYQQRASVGDDGQFEVTVPYPTDEELTVEDGYTNSGVVANGTYDIQVTGAEQETVAVGTAEVPERAVVDGETVEVTLEEPEPENDGNDTSSENGGNDTSSENDEGGSQDDSGSGRYRTPSMAATPIADARG